jgi:hypothetical protein
MKIPTFISIAAGAMLFWCPEAVKSSPLITPQLPAGIAHVSVENPTDQTRWDTVLHLPVDKLGLMAERRVRDLVVYHENRPLPTQPLDADGDGEFESVATLVDLEAGEKLSLKVVVDETVAGTRPWPKRTQAELSRKNGGTWEDGAYVDGDFANVASVTFEGQLPDHNDFMRYEGPGWESDKVGYRLYLDHRNAIDVFGKTLPAMVLQDVGKDGYGSYHEPAAWGMDILKVGSALGIGGFGAWADGKAHRLAQTDRTRCAVLSNGPLTSQILLDYAGWKTPVGKADLKAILSIEAGSYLTKVTLMLEDSFPTMVTGIPKHPDVQCIKGETDVPGEAWTYLAAYGPQSLSGNNLGLVVFVRRDGFAGFAEDEDNQLIRLNPNDGKAIYRFGALWESSTDEAATLEAFNHWIESTLDRLNREPVVSIRTTETP